MAHDSTSTERRDVHFQGHVQGVGFRYTTRNLATRFEVTGFVRNLPDGRVHLVVEGTRGELDRLLAAVKESLGGYIRDTQIDVQPATGEWRGFEIRF